MALNIARHESIPQSGEVDISSIPDSEHRAQADAAIRDLFPRIPHPDRQMIINTSFTRVCYLKLSIFLILLLTVALATRLQTPGRSVPGCSSLSPRTAGSAGSYSPCPH